MHQLETIYEDVHRTLAAKNLTAAEKSELHSSGFRDQIFRSNSGNGLCPGATSG